MYFQAVTGYWLKLVTGGNWLLMVIDCKQLLVAGNDSKCFQVVTVTGGNLSRVIIGYSW